MASRSPGIREAILTLFSVASTHHAAVFGADVVKHRVKLACLPCLMLYYQELGC
jgi:hypothetical protein